MDERDVRIACAYFGIAIFLMLAIPTGVILFVNLYNTNAFLNSQSLLPTIIPGSIIAISGSIGFIFFVLFIVKSWRQLFGWRSKDA